MDQREMELKALKKAYRRTMRSYAGVWNVCAVVFLLLGLAAGVLCLCPGELCGDMRAFLLHIGVDALLLQGAAALCAALFLLFALVSRAEKRKVKRSSVYLDYQTMKNTLKAEKQAFRQ